jgi:WD40 repeat protein
MQKGPQRRHGRRGLHRPLWEQKTGKEIIHFDQHQAIVNSVIFTPDSQHALSGSADHTLRLWQLPR